MDNNPFYYKTYRNPGTTVGTDPFWQGIVSLKGTFSPEDVAAMVAADTRQSVSDVSYTHSKTGEAIRKILRNGYNANLDWVGFGSVLTGSFMRADSGFNPSRNALVVRAHARPFLRDCLADITPRNITSGLKATIHSVVDGTAREESVVTSSMVYVAGLNLLVGDAPDEGVWLMAKDGDVAVTPEIVANTVATLDLRFGELPPDGDYTLVVKARSGAPLDFAPATARRNVVVRRAN